MGIFEEAAIFRGVTKEDARQMLNCLNPVEKTHKKDEIIYHAGDEVTSMGVVLSGSVFIENDDIWGNHSILDRAGRGEIFAETYAAIPGQKLMVNVVAAEEARILFLDVGRILKVCSNSCVFHHTLIENLLKLPAEKNLRLSKRIFHIHQNRSGEDCCRICLIRLWKTERKNLTSHSTGSSLQII